MYSLTCITQYFNISIFINERYQYYNTYNLLNTNLLIMKTENRILKGTYPQNTHRFQFTRIHKYLTLQSLETRHSQSILHGKSIINNRQASRTK
jgi:hypothetical protein